MLAVASCALFPNGYFNAYQAIADLPRVDAVLHLGDYIYEYGGPDSYGMDSAVAGERPHDPPREILSLDDYRRRHAQYKSDPGLQAAHARRRGSSSGTTTRPPTTAARPAPRTIRRRPKATGPCARPRRSRPISSGCRSASPPAAAPWPTRSIAASISATSPALIMIETRLTARDQQVSLDGDAPEINGKRDLTKLKAKLADPKRRMMGPKQEAWVAGELARRSRPGTSGR